MAVLSGDALAGALDALRLDLYPFQREGLQHIASQERMAYMQWSTGTGKTVAAEGTILLKRAEGFDLTLYVVRPNHLEGARRKLLWHTGIEGVVLEGTPAKRIDILDAVGNAAARGEQPVLIMNPEKFSADRDLLTLLVAGRRVLLLFDEAQKRFGNRKTKTYRDACEVLYTAKTEGGIHYPRKGYERPKQIFGVALSATPITRSPDNLFNTVRLLHPGYLGSVNDFNNRYVAWRNQWGQPVEWKNLDDLAARVAPLVHQADKEKDPEIAAQFPAVTEETVFCDMDDRTAYLYGMLQQEYRNIGLASMLSYDEVLAAIGCLQMIVSNPRAVLASAKEREEYEGDLEAFIEYLEDEGVGRRERANDLKEFERLYRRGSEVAMKLRAKIADDSYFADGKKGVETNGKLVVLREYLEEHDGKAVVFTTETRMLDLISEWLDRWEIEHVCYHGALSAKARTAAIDTFREDPEVKVFLSTDAGQDSIDLPEADLTIHYDWPWSWAEVQQRQNRQHRIDSQKDSVRVITLTVPGTVEDRKAEIVARKHGYHEAIFEGAAFEPGEEEQLDYLYVLTGQGRGEDFAEPDA